MLGTMCRGPWGRYLLSLLLFGSNGIVASRILLSSCQIVWLRTGLGSLLLVGALVLGRRHAFLRWRRETGMLALSGMALGVSWIFLYEAYRRIGVSLASLLYYCGPVIVMALSPVLFRERLTGRKLAGLGAVLAGLLLVNGRTDGALDPWGLACGALSAVLYAAMVICSKKAPHIAGVENAALQVAASFLTVTGFLAAGGDWPAAVPSTSWPWVLTLGILNTAVGCYLYFSSIHCLPVQTVAVCGYLEPLSAVALSVALLGEAMSPLQALGALCILGGAAWSGTAGLPRALSLPRMALPLPGRARRPIPVIRGKRH